MGVIDRRSEDKSVCLSCLGNKGIAEIIFKEASFFRAFIASDAVPDLFHANRKDFAFYPKGFQLRSNFL